MSGSQIVFYVLGAVAVLAGIGVITSKNAVHSALFLIAALMSVAGIYVVVEAEFLAAVQVLVYAGGVMVLFLFVIMLVDLEQRGRKQEAARRVSKGAIVGGAVLAGILLVLLLSTFLYQSLGAPAQTADALRAEGGNLASVAMTMFRSYL